MRYHIYTDNAGWVRRVLLRDGDPATAARKIGIPADPPDLAGLGDIAGLTDEARRDLHNALAERGLYTWQDVVARGNAITAAVAALTRQYKLDGSALKRAVVQLYRSRR
jgi:hypothetical protein